MPTVLNAGDRERLWKRIASVTEASAPRWGGFTATGMMTHLRLSGQMAVGDIPFSVKGPIVFRTFPLKQMILYVLPFPKGARTAAELLAPALAPAPGQLEAERTALLGLFDRLTMASAPGALGTHPLFGPLTRGQWGALTYKHYDHHLRQFGV